MAYQFIHVSTYSIKTGGKGVAAEAGRKPDHSKHIENPKPPIHLAGMSTDDAWDEIERRKDNTQVSIVDKNGVTRHRKMRNDQLVMLAAVASWPTPTVEQDPEDPVFKEWIKDTLEYFEQKHGAPLSAVLHLDESNPHIHFITAPNLEAGQTMSDIHQGEQAKKDLGGRSAGKIDKKRAYKDAMREYQDEYHNAVSIRYAHARLGPQRPRLTRDQWKATEAENKRVAGVIREIETRNDELGSKAASLDSKGAALRAEIASHSVRVDLDKKTIKTLSSKQEKTSENLKKREEKLKNRTAKIKEREQKAEHVIRQNTGFYGRALSVMTFGAKGVEKAVREAKKAARDDAQKEIATIQERLDKTKKAASARQRKIQNLETDISEKDATIKAKELEIQDLKNEVEGVQLSLSEERKRMLPLEGEIGTLKKKNRIVSSKLDSLKESLESLDIDKAKTVIAEIESEIKPGGGTGGTGGAPFGNPGGNELPDGNKFSDSGFNHT